MGKHYSMLYPQEGKLRGEPENHLKIAVSEGKFRGEGLRQRKNGEQFLADVFITPMYDSEELIGFFKIVSDLTERNRVIQERDLTRAKVETLEHEKELRERFLYMLSHDLRNPLTSAKTSLDLMKEQEEDSQEREKLIHMALKNIDRIDGMITDLLDVSRIRKGQAFPIHIKEFDLCGLLKEVCQEFAAVHGDRIKIRDACSIRGHWDPEGLKRVVENLLTNAIKYGAPEGEVSLQALDREDRVFIKVHNIGSPIKAKDQEQLFELFHQMNPEEHPNGGWGLGLTLVRGITEAHGGVVKVQSLSKQGTTFTIDLPRDARGKQVS